jgi:hypothetical protein
MFYTLCVNLKKECYPPESSTNSKFKENYSQQFTSPCNINHRKYMTLQSNDVAACEIEKSHMAFSHVQKLSYTGGNVRKCSQTVYTNNLPSTCTHNINALCTHKKLTVNQKYGGYSTVTVLTKHGCQST